MLVAAEDRAVGKQERRGNSHHEQDGEAHGPWPRAQLLTIADQQPQQRDLRRHYVANGVGPQQVRALTHPERTREEPAEYEDQADRQPQAGHVLSLPLPHGLPKPTQERNERQSKPDYQNRQLPRQSDRQLTLLVERRGHVLRLDVTRLP